ncbi:gamma-glutamylcyclotransferase family protein [Thioalkalivibrio sp. ALE23]|uniref:gamma-glutamylcyclotransferase family protein n=1 Tax=Thioalkalivibrio sp. ALE23 TaxID=1265495 RepID=UPI0003670C33|nr:gamma-glutamylcyclotransferase family protein [Thioalkalivibrio sp. ALE23]
MFRYFGFGSNLDLISLRAKGVEPVRSRPAVLHGWQLRFNVRHFFRHEGGVGNIEPSATPGDRVVGILHECPDDSLPALDKVEAKGVGYDRIVVEVETPEGSESAYAYRGRPDFLDDRCLPSQRYLNILIRGAERAGLDREHIARLRAQPTLAVEDAPPFEHPPGSHPRFDARSLPEYPHFTALYGAVFDMSDARPAHAWLRDFFGGQDMTLFHLRRMDTSDGSETLEDLRADRLGPTQRQYLYNYLREYDREYRYVGHFDYH